MLSHNQTKYINSLKIKKYRLQYGAFIVEGEKGINELLLSSIKPVKIFAVAKWIDSNASQLKQKHIEHQEITADELKRVSDLVTPNQVLAIAEIPKTELLEVINFSDMTIALDGIRDPGNMGTMIRTADWFGIKRIICSSDSVDVYNPKVIQATMGSFSRVTVYYTDLTNLFKTLPESVPVYGALLEGSDLTQKTFTRKGIILIGSESHGISKELIPYVTEPLHIPRFSDSNTGNQAESLNASVANGIICYEICKQLSKYIF